MDDLPPISLGIQKDILFPKCVNRPLVNTGKFLFNPYICVIVCDIFICDVEAVPGQAGDLPIRMEQAKARLIAI